MEKKTIDKIINIQTGIELNWDRFIKLKDNSILKVKIDLFEEWDFEKNEQFGLDIYEVTKGQKVKPWWKCKNSKCNGSYQARPTDKINKNSGCPYCSGSRANNRNSLASLNPELASQWHPTLNGDLTPERVVTGSHQKVWWICNLGHEFDCIIRDRVNKGINCQYCSGRKVLKGYNDISTTHPQYYDIMLNKEEAYKNTYGSHQRVDWKCPDCNHIIKNKVIKTVIRSGLSCPVCSDGKSYPEKVMHNLLLSLNINFKPQKKFNWSDGKIYDFYLPEYNLIIETHGKQHYIDNCFGSLDGDSLEQTQTNDKYKYNIAMNNGVDKYIIIDYRKSELEWIKNNILNSELSEIFDLNNIDWTDIDIKASKSNHILFLELWNQGLSVIQIIKETKSSETTIGKALKKFSKQGLCIYPRSK